MFLPATLQSPGLTPGTVPFFMGDSAIVAQHYGAQGYLLDQPRGTLTAVAATDVYSGGFRYTQPGVIRLFDATAGLPAGVTYNGGLAVSQDGQLCITFDPVDASSVFVNGVACKQSGAVHSADLTMSFVLPLDDLGGGQVNLVPTVGTGSATFTRATVAWTKLASGLWASVASGVARSCYLGATTAASDYGGYFAEPAATQLVTPTASIRDMTNAAWIKGATMTAAKTGTGIDGVTNSCSRLTGGAVSATNTAFQTLVAAASSRTYSCWIKRVTGTGVINITQNGGTAYTDVTSQINSSTFTRVELNASVLNAAFGIQVVTNGDVILVDFNQFEAGAVATSPMDAAGAARNADVLTYPLAGNFSDASGTIYEEVNPGNSLPTYSNCPVIGNNGTATLLLTTPDATGAFDGTNFSTGPSIAMSNGTFIKAATRWGSSLNVIVNGSLGTQVAYDGTWGFATIQIGNTTTGDPAVQYFAGMIRNVRIWPTQLSDAQL